MDGRTKLAIALSLVGLVVILAGTAYVFPTASNQGYSPEQPIPFSHKLHAGQYKMACIYCHSSVEKSKHASVPSLNVCMNCHSVVKINSPYIQQIRKAYAEGRPIEWVRVHELPDYAYFPHKRHVAAGLSCQNCHGNVQEMSRVYQKSALTMGWCIECHRNPEKFIRPKDEVTNLKWERPTSQESVVKELLLHNVAKDASEARTMLAANADPATAFGMALKDKNGVHTRQSCSTCHR